MELYEITPEGKKLVANFRFRDEPSTLEIMSEVRCILERKRITPTSTSRVYDAYTLSQTTTLPFHHSCHLKRTKDAEWEERNFIIQEWKP